MDDVAVSSQLEIAELYVLEGERRVRGQKALIAEMYRDGHDLTAALKMLGVYQMTLRVLIEQRDTLKVQLARLRH
jgi:hypothetical protein